MYFFQGLQETKHPYTFVAREGFREMLEVDDARSRTLPVLSKLIVPLRAALVRFATLRLTGHSHLSACANSSNQSMKSSGCTFQNGMDK